MGRSTSSSIYGALGTTGILGTNSSSETGASIIEGEIGMFGIVIGSVGDTGNVGVTGTTGGTGPTGTTNSGVDISFATESGIVGISGSAN